MFSWVTKQAGLTLEPDAQGEVTVQEGVDDEAAAGASVLMNMGNDCNDGYSLPGEGTNMPST